MSANTTILVRVLKVHEEVLQISAVTLQEAEEQARKMEDVVAVIESRYPEYEGEIS